MLVGGGAPRSWTWSTRSAADFPRTALFILVTTYLILLLLLRSVVLPAKALVMNTLSILASFGALVWIFQDGNLSAPLGFVPPGFVETTMPVILFCVLFGLSMDYEVFLLSRMKETWDRTGDNRDVGGERPGAERSDRDQRRGDRGPGGGLVRASRMWCSSRHWASASRSRWRSTRRWSGHSWCPPPCACSVAGTGGCRERLRRWLGSRLPVVEA